MFIRLAILILYFLCQNSFAEPVKLKYPSCVNNICLNGKDVSINSFIKKFGRGLPVFKKYRPDGGEFANSYCFYNSKNQYIVFDYRKELGFFVTILVTQTPMCEKTESNKFVIEDLILSNNENIGILYEDFVKKFIIDKNHNSTIKTFEEHLGSFFLLDELGNDNLDAKIYYFMNGRLNAILYTING